jgi:hypothetical protein
MRVNYGGDAVDVGNFSVSSGKTFYAVTVTVLLDTIAPMYVIKPLQQMGAQIWGQKRQFFSSFSDTRTAVKRDSLPFSNRLGSSQILYFTGGF